MKPNDYLTYDTVCELGERQYDQFRQSLRDRGYHISDTSGTFAWTITTDVDYDPNKLCLFLDATGDLNWGEIADQDLAGNEISLDEALAMIDTELDKKILSMTIGEIRSKIEQMEDQLEAINEQHRQQHQELTKWRERVRRAVGRDTMNLKENK